MNVPQVWNKRQEKKPLFSLLHKINNVYNVQMSLEE